MKLPYDAILVDGCYDVSIDETFKVTIVDEAGSGETLRVQLASEAECERLIKELEDPEGTLMWQDDAICTIHSELHQLRP